MISQPQVQRKLQQHLAPANNPICKPETHAKAHAVLLAKGYPMLNGGNGHGPSGPQLLLAQRLSWPMEWIVPTREKKDSGYPSHYKLDIAEPSLQVAIEVDGQSHHCTRIRERDDKKDAFLFSRGWLVLRFWNEEILEDLDRVEACIRSTISKRARVTISSTASSSIIAIA
jgi:hypothetical protein